MSRITKTIAESVAIQLAEPKKVELRELRQKSLDLITEVIKKTIPKEVLDLFEKHPKYFSTSSSTRFNCAGFGYEWYRFNSLPENKDYPSISVKDGEKILSITEKITKKEQEYRHLKEEIEIALIGLRTYNNVQKEFPEAFKLLPNIVTTALTVDLKSIRCKLDKNNCK